MSGGELAGLAIAEARRLLDGREISSAELTADCLAVGRPGRRFERLHVEDAGGGDGNGGGGRCAHRQG